MTPRRSPARVAAGRPAASETVDAVRRKAVRGSVRRASAKADKRLAVAKSAEDVKRGLRAVSEVVDVLQESSSADFNDLAPVVKAAIKAYARTPTGQAHLARLGRR